MSIATVALRAIALDIVHDVVDHVVQTDHQAGAKSSAIGAQWWPAMAAHAGGQALAQGGALAVVEVASGRRSWARVLAGAAAIGASHAFLDRRWPVVELLRATGSARFACAMTPEHFHGLTVDGRNMIDDDGSRPLPLHGPYLADQALHRGVTLAVAAALC